MRELIKKVGKKYKYDRDNCVYLVKVKGNDEDADDAYEKFKEDYEKAANEHGERLQWRLDNHINISMSTQSEASALAELEAALGGKGEARPKIVNKSEEK